MFNIYLILYILVCIVIAPGGTYQLYNMGNTVGAVLYFVATTAICILYGLRWFGPNGMLAKTPVSWPSTINTCPDYLTHYTRTLASGTQDTCIDLIGVSRNGKLQRFNKDGDPPSTEEYYFKLATTSSDPDAKNMELCYRAITLGLTWEGITNGESCITLSGDMVGPGSRGSGSCSK